jgi:hypothetical protein
VTEAIHFYMPYPALGDKICFLSAARIYARIFPDAKVSVGQSLPDIIDAYGDGLLSAGREGRTISVAPGPWHRLHDHRGNNNYVGTYLREMGVQTPPVRPELPEVEPANGLEPGSYVAFQPWANFARDPDAAFIQQLLDVVRGKLMIVKVGKAGEHNPDFWEVAFPNWMGPPMNMLRVIRHARFVLTPRSASAHVAAAYGVPTVVWVPSDGENWHLDYPEWPHMLVEFERSGWMLAAQMARAAVWMEEMLCER